jgi:hypothetical protein
MNTAPFFLAAAAIAQSFFPMTAAAGDILLWKSSAPTAHLYVHDRSGDRTLPCYATRYRASDGSIYGRDAECPVEFSAYSDIGMPDGYYTKGQATHAAIQASGMITLW